MPAITAELAFQQAANRAADVYAQRPPYVTYDVNVRAQAPSMNQDRTVLRHVETRTRDDLAVVQDLPQGRNVLARSFPVSPVFDALSYFRFEWHVTAHGTLDAYVTDVVPLVYNLTPQETKTDVFVASLRYYRATYAADSSDAPNGVSHINLTAYDFVKAEGARNTLYYTDLYIDNASKLPVDVRMGGINGLLLDVRYTVAGNHWVVDGVHYEETILVPLGVARFHVISDAKYSKYTFPTAAPDPRLAEPGASATPLPTFTPAPLAPAGTPVPLPSR
jgi:hypothetical protein